MASRAHDAENVAQVEVVSAGSPWVIPRGELLRYGKVFNLDWKSVEIFVNFHSFGKTNNLFSKPWRVNTYTTKAWPKVYALQRPKKFVICLRNCLAPLLGIYL